MAKRIPSPSKKRKPVTNNHEQDQPMRQLQPRPFEETEDAETASYMTQAERDRLALAAPTLADMPVNDEPIPASEEAASNLQVQAREEPHKAPQGTGQRQQQDRQEQDEQLALQTQQSAEDAEIQAETDPEKQALQQQAESKIQQAEQQEEALVTEEQKDAEVQTKVEEESQKTLEQESETAKAEDELAQTEQQLVQAQEQDTKKKKNK